MWGEEVCRRECWVGSERVWRRECGGGSVWEEAWGGSERVWGMECGEGVRECRGRECNCVRKGEVCLVVCGQC